MPLPRPLRQVLGADATLAAWQARHAREEALTAAVRRYLPRQLGERLRATLPGDGGIELVAPSGAVAAAVRQRGPDLLRALEREGWPASALRVRVRPLPGVPKVIPIPGPPPGKAEMAPLAELARSLPPGPLKVALARLVRRAG